MLERSQTINSLFSTGRSHKFDCDVFSSLENEPFSALVISSNFGSPASPMTMCRVPTTQDFSQTHYLEKASLNEPKFSNYYPIRDFSKENDQQLLFDNLRKRTRKDDYQYLKRYKCTESLSIARISEEILKVDEFFDSAGDQQEYNEHEYAELFRVPKNDSKFSRFLSSAHDRSFELQNQNEDENLPKWPTTIRGCKCKHSKCLKSYCGCFKRNLHCNPLYCYCVTCNNKENDLMWKAVISMKSGFGK